MSPSCCNSGAGHHGDSVSSWSEILLQTVVKFNESAPWLTVGLVTTVVLKQIKLPTITVRRFLTFAGPDPSFLELFSLCFTASLLGLATPLCSCGAIPMAIGLAAFLPTATEAIIQLPPVGKRGLAMALFSQCFAISALLGVIT